MSRGFQRVIVTGHLGADPAVKAPQNTSFLVERVMLMKPPQPTGRPLNLLTLTLPWLSVCARPKKLASRPPPS